MQLIWIWMGVRPVRGLLLFTAMDCVARRGISACRGILLPVPSRQVNTVVRRGERVVAMGAEYDNSRPPWTSRLLAVVGYLGLTPLLRLFRIRRHDSYL